MRYWGWRFRRDFLWVTGFRIFVDARSRGVSVCAGFLVWAGKGFSLEVLALEFRGYSQCGKGFGVRGFGALAVCSRIIFQNLVGKSSGFHPFTAGNQLNPKLNLHIQPCHSLKPVAGSATPLFIQLSVWKKLCKRTRKLLFRVWVSGLGSGKENGSHASWEVI